MPSLCPARLTGGPGACGYLKLLPLSQQPEPLVESTYVRALKEARRLGGSVHLSAVTTMIKQHHNNANSRLKLEDKVC